MITTDRRIAQINRVRGWLDELSTLAKGAMADGPLVYNSQTDGSGDVHDALGKLGNIAQSAFEDLKMQIEEIATLKIEQASNHGPTGEV